MFDNLSKFLAQQYPEDFASWLVGAPIRLTDLKPTELSLEPIRADSVILLKSEQVIAHCEFQTDPDADMGFRMADYNLRIFRKYPDRALVQVVVYLRKTTSEAVYRTTFCANRMTHEFQVIRLWEQPTAPFLERPGLWPYAALTDTDDRAGVLQAVARKIDALPDRTQRSNLSAISAVISGLSLDREIIQQILRRDLMQESVMYQEMQEWAKTDAEARVEARVEARAEARAEVIANQQVLTRERSLILRQLTRKVGTIPDRILDRLTALSLAQLESLGEALLDFGAIADLTTWLENQE